MLPLLAYFSHSCLTLSHDCRRTSWRTSTTAPNGAPDNDRKAKESSWLVSQAFIEGLRYYPTGQTAIDSNDCEATYSGNTHSKRVMAFEHMETDLRSRLDIATADTEWRDDQLPREWVPEKRPSMVRHMAKVRERLKR